MLSKNDLKNIRKLHQKKHREGQAQFLAEGPKVIGDLLQTGLQPVRIFAMTPEVYPNAVLVSGAELKQISLLDAPNEAVAIFQKPTFEWPTQLDRVLVLDGIRDPGNMGTLLRLADWFGLEAVVCSADCVDIWNPKTVQSSMGSLGRIPFFQGPLLDLMAYLNNAALPVFGTFLEGESIYQLEVPERFALVMGSESHGVSSELERFIHQKIHIPRHPKGQAESLNVAMACGIVLGFWGKMG